jgi:hypothetical protein
LSTHLRLGHDVTYNNHKWKRKLNITYLRSQAKAQTSAEQAATDGLMCWMRSASSSLINNVVRNAKFGLQAFNGRVKMRRSLHCWSAVWIWNEFLKLRKLSLPTSSQTKVMLASVTLEVISQCLGWSLGKTLLYSVAVKALNRKGCTWYEWWWQTRSEPESFWTQVTLPYR